MSKQMNDRGTTMRLFTSTSVALAAALLAAHPALAVLPTSQQKCEAAFESASGKFAQCRLNAESKYSKTVDAVKLATALGKCSTKLSDALGKAVTKFGGGNCTSEAPAAFDAYLTQCSNDVEAASGLGGALPACGDGAINVAGEQCDGVALGGETCSSLGFPGGGTLACTGACAFDTSACDPSLCGNAAIDAPEQCDGVDLGGATCTSLGYTLGGTLGCTAGCGYDTTACASQSAPATGQTTCWNTAGAVIPCAGTGHDGEVQAGATLAYTDNGDGTITDNNTGLMWEKLDDNNVGGIHDLHNTYTWANAFAVKIATLNGAAFAGHTDWRVPNDKELYSITNHQNAVPAVSAVFNTGCVPGCTVATCSCTLSGFYWSSSTFASSPVFAWHMNFFDGSVRANDKASAAYVRAVRGGS